MKKLLVATLGLFCATTLAVRAQDEKPKRTEEQKTLMKEMVTKYDANKDGKLDKDERAKISAEDKAKMEKAGLTHKKKETAAAAPAEKK
jgi:hypothetical protein